MRGRVAFRVDASAQIGLGHFVRCLALATAIRENFEVNFYCVDYFDNLIDQLSSETLQAHVISEEKDFLGQLGPTDIAVVDGYQFDKAYQQSIKDRGASLVCIDDLAAGAFVADVIINHAPGMNSAAYDALPNTRFFLGPDYALLRRSFLEQSRVSRSVGPLEHLFINFGGSDPQNLTLRSAKIALALNRFKTITVAMGPGYKFGDQLISEFYERPEVHCIKNLSEPEMLKAIVSSDLAVVPASGVLYETIASRTLCISGFYVDNQSQIYRGFKAMGGFYDAGNFSEKGLVNAFELAFRSDSDRLLARQRSCIDGESPGRLLNIFKNLSLE